MAEIAAAIVSALGAAVGWVFSPSWLPPKDFELFRWLIVPGYGYGIVLVALAVAELVFPQVRRPWSRRSSLSATYLVLTGKLGFYGLIVAPLMRHIWLELGLPSLHLDRLLPLWIYIPWAVLVVTFCDYWAHRLMHRAPGMWQLHKIHHSVENLNWSSIYQHHFLESFFSIPFHLAAVLALGTDIVAPFGILFRLLDVLGHANVRLDAGRLTYLFSTPQAHRIHHSRAERHHDSNFGNTFMLWDHVFGTFRYDPRDLPTAYGVPDAIPLSFFKQQILPLGWFAKDIFHAVTKRGNQPRSSETRDAEADVPAAPMTAGRTCTECGGQLDAGRTEVRIGKVAWMTAVTLCAGSCLAFSLGVGVEVQPMVRIAGAVTAGLLGLLFLAGLLRPWERETARCMACERTTVRDIDWASRRAAA